ncbi:MAG: GAF and ANTAR domain-containing protein, partial [Acidimicrobiales bacterium]
GHHDGHADGIAAVMALCGASSAQLGIDEFALSLIDGQHHSTTTRASGQRSELVDQLQLTLGEGPSIDTQFSGGPVFVADLDAPSAGARWPAFARSAVGAGFRAAFAFPLQIGAIHMGVLTLYREAPMPLSPGNATTAAKMSSTIAAIVSGIADEPGLPLSEAANDLVRPRAVIHQATGMIVAQLDTTPDRALARLRARSYAEGRVLQDLATDVVSRRIRFD